ncbi:HypC/HybG/HupF family hydrogenase formation chaperone [Paracraurococcus lichenis]|uniref:HypC/HybG/HupF family hydrogenase formation chaperone n=1 Tax=Paracraurococcus lichenis TaxID=3064888 RepID=A0ABT9DZZ8_9PROT|nr:HypC/HybG/HupF family hydrogenase formation chaperone [Paracraurococcus sp. LOR1-02]MDO9709320.1 HypC/HybG/HupF family hydrogenase formation chaperone [Paracraurococcus sp. LOR1-02]
MCLAVPARILELRGETEAVAELGGVRIPVSLALVEDVAVGDHVVVHVGYALAKIDAAEAARMLDALEQLPQVA